MFEYKKLKEENMDLRFENEELKLSKDISERRNIEYARLFKKISEEVNKNQLNSVINLQNKIKSMLTNFDTTLTY